MKILITRTITGMLYLFILGSALFLSKYVLLTVFTAFLIIAIIEYILLAQKFPTPKSNMQQLTQRIILPAFWIVMPVLLLEYWCIGLNAIPFVVALFIILCTNDSLAYVLGSLFGRYKLWPKVSPKKSWEGFIGGLICTMAVSWSFAKIPYFQNEVFTNLYAWMGFAFVVIIAGTFGDFAESMVKRYAQQKDSGAILPGHGGILDRIDSMLFAVPVGFIYWACLKILL